MIEDEYACLDLGDGGLYWPLPREYECYRCPQPATCYRLLKSHDSPAPLCSRCARDPDVLLDPVQFMMVRGEQAGTVVRLGRQGPF